MCFASFELIVNTIFNENEPKKITKYSAYCHRLPYEYGNTIEKNSS